VGSRAIPIQVDRPLGVSRLTDRHRSEMAVGDGEMVFLFTDGLIERRDIDIDARHAELVAALNGASGVWAEIACADVMSALLGGTEDNDDDVTVLAIRRGIDS
jgi:serine phosphatase RsbU (regulator of sigma subunit)